jgi:hypothetical protein
VRVQEEFAMELAMDTTRITSALKGAPVAEKLKSL